MITIGFTMGPDGKPVSEIDWPKTIRSDHQMLMMVREIRRSGIKAVTHINKTSDMTDTLEVHTDHQVAVYRKGLYQPMVKPSLALWGEPRTAYIPPPETCWIFEQVMAIGGMDDEYARLAQQLARHIPDIRKNVKSPCNCVKYTHGEIFYVIQHLNDFHHPDIKVLLPKTRQRWTREQIADWLDEVDADLVFDPDLPAKRRAMRGPSLNQLMQAGVISQHHAIEQITGEFKAVEPKIDDLKDSIVKLDVAIEEFAASIHESLTKAHQECACHMCAKKEES